MLQLRPDCEQKSRLLCTMETFNAACSAIADVAFEQRTANKIRLQHLVYYDIRERFGLSAQLVVRAISKVCEAFKVSRGRKPVFQPHGAVVYDQRSLSFKGLDLASILTVAGRVLVPLVMYRYAADRLRIYDRCGQADLIYQDGDFYLAVVVDIPEPPPTEGGDVLGVDLGIVNLATDSDGEAFSGDEVGRTRRHYEHRRTSLQKIGTKSSRKRLKKTKSKERRFKKDTNHVISKRIVVKAKGTSRGLALEDLTGIQGRTTVRKAERTRHTKWAFAQLRGFIEYKARLAGVPVLIVDPRNTSKTCSVCGTVDQRNRPNQATFLCVGCGFRCHADINAALNLRARALVSAPMVLAAPQHEVAESRTSL